MIGRNEAGIGRLVHTLTVRLRQVKKMTTLDEIRLDRL